MANAAFDAWVVKYLGAVSAYNKQAVESYNATRFGGRNPHRNAAISAYNKILTLRSDLAVILNSSAIGSAAISSLDKIISSGEQTKSGGLPPLRTKNIQEWIKKYSDLVR